MKVAIILGSKSDINKMKGASKCLEEFGIYYEAYVVSAHRIPEKLDQIIQKFEEEDFEIIITGAGLAAHLPGVIASKTILPVIGVPLEAKLNGLDALFSIVQMPKNIPVATVGLDNSYNAGMLACEILALKYPKIKEKLLNFRKKMKEDFLNDGIEIVDF